ncbi:hypothetical protein QUA26_28125 [Microcoleus sp. Pol12A4]
MTRSKIVKLSPHLSNTIDNLDAQNLNDMVAVISTLAKRSG